MAADSNGVRRNVDVTGTDFPARLRELRTQRRLTKARLAALSGLTPRSISDFENGRRGRVLESSLMLLARALDVGYEDLVGRPPELAPAAAEPPPAPPPALPPAQARPDSPPADRRPSARHPWRRWLALTALLLLLAAGGAAVHEQAMASARVGIEDGALVARDGILGRPIWRYDGAPAEVVRWHETPWSPELILFGLGSDHFGLGAVVLAHRRTGRVLWTIRPDRDLIAQAFPEEGASLEDHESFARALFLELDGDGQKELLVQFDDSWQPRSYLCLIEADGTVIGQYCHLGRLTSLLTQDVDEDGKEEVLAAGQNMASCLRGASFLLLDDECCRGASRDTLCGPVAGLPDSARTRLALPSFGEPYMSLLGYVCLEAVVLRTFETAEGELRICADVGCGPDYIIVTMDAGLRPLLADVSDVMIGASMDWPEPLRRTGPADGAWLSDWFARAVRFEVGRPQPPAGP